MNYRALALMLLAASAGEPLAAQLPESSLAVQDGARWIEWWRSEAAPARWAAPLPALADLVYWRAAQPGLDWGELRLAGRGEAWRLRVIVVRLDPRQLRLELERAAGRDRGAGGWTVDSPGPEAVLAVNAGQFAGGLPWGWLVLRGREHQPPGKGPLSVALTVDAAGLVAWVPPDSIAAVRAAGQSVEAFQSYPVLLRGDGEIPLELTAADRGVDLSHRDTRLALGELRDGRLLLALTRFDALGDAFSVLPFGPTVPEMAALMGALGCRRAVMLDGGISAQLWLRGRDGVTRAWRGLRKVPLGLVATPRTG